MQNDPKKLLRSLRTSNLKFNIIFLAILFFAFFGLAGKSFAAEHYIRAGAEGSNDGSDWTDAFFDIPSVFVRGDTYYIASGTYGGNYTFNMPEVSTNYISIKKAIIGTHGSAGDWNDAYGEGVAVFSGTFSIDTGYWYFDGVLGGGPDNWKAGHGFEFTSVAGTNISYFQIADGVSHLQIHHIYFNQSGDTTAYGVLTSAIYDAGALNDSLVEYCYFDNLGGTPFLLRTGSGNIIQYNYTGDICGASVFDADLHCEALVEHGMNDVQFRYNYIADSPSTGGFVKNNINTSDSIRIYGNTFNSGNPIDCNSGICTNWRIFNNTFVHNSYGPFSGDGTNSGLLFYNNVVFDNPSMVSLGSYAWVSQVSGQCNSHADITSNVTIRYPSDCDLYPETSDPFVNSPGNYPEDFRLASPISGWPGYDVCQLDSCVGENKYNIDLFGNVRGADDVWDRGAYEYQAGSSDVLAPTAPSGLAVN